MDIRQLQYFLAIVDRGGYNRAAAALYVSQPSLSQAVRALEHDLAPSSSTESGGAPYSPRRAGR